MRKSPSLENKLAALGELRKDPSSPESRKELARALAARSNLLAARAAKIAGEASLQDLVTQLVDAFDRFLVNPETADKGCDAKTEIVRALVARAQFPGRLLARHSTRADGTHLDSTL